MLKKILFCAFFFLAGAIAAEEKIVEIIPLHHRPADEMVPLLRPFLASDDALIAHRSQLIVKTSPARLEEIQALIQKLDKAPRRLKITVVQGENLNLEKLKAGAPLEGRYYSARSQASENHVQHVQTLEGKPAYIQFGQQRPLPSIFVSPYGGVAPTIEYRQFTTGFAVAPRMVGRSVILEIYPWSERLNPQGNGIVDIRQASATIKAELGEWVEIGGQIEDQSVSENAPLARIRTTRAQNDRIFLKVEDLDADSR